MTILTHSSRSCFNQCRRKYQLRYVLGLRRDRTDQPLRLGSAFHLGLDTLAKTNDIGAACQAVRDNYADVPAWVHTEPDGLYDWMIECETVLRLLAGYHWRWQESDAATEIVETESTFHLPILNPETGRPTPNFTRAGKRDKIVRRDGFTLLREHKTTSENLDADGDYWKRLRMDSQLSGYASAAIAAGVQIDGIEYDVVRKPRLKPKHVPILDGEGLKIVLNPDGSRAMTKQGKPRQSADSDAGQTMKTRMESVPEFGQRVTDDIGERPDEYFVRKMIPRLPADLDEFNAEMWDDQVLIRHCEKADTWTRNTGACKAWGRTCEYFDLCAAGNDPKHIAAHPPTGFIMLKDTHPELDLPDTDA